MSFTKLTIVGALALALCIFQSANADISITIEIDPDIDATTDTTTSVSFFAESNVAGGEMVRSINLPIDVGGEGGQNVLPSGITFNAAPIANSAFSESSFGPSDISFKFDGLVNLQQLSGFNIEDNPTLLFDLVLDVAAGTPDGEYLVTAPAFSNPFFTISAGGGGAYTGSVSDPVPGSVNIASVPEPSSLALIVAGLGGLLVRRRRN